MVRALSLLPINVREATKPHTAWVRAYTVLYLGACLVLGTPARSEYSCCSVLHCNAFQFGVRQKGSRLPQQDSTGQARGKNRTTVVSRGIPRLI